MNYQEQDLAVAQKEYFYEMLAAIKQRPGMYLGKCLITRLRSFLDGYRGARVDLGIAVTEQEKDFDRLQEWIQKRFKITSSQGWESIILFYSVDEREALNYFFELLAAFRQEKILSLSKVSKSID